MHHFFITGYQLISSCTSSLAGTFWIQIQFYVDLYEAKRELPFSILHHLARAAAKIISKLKPASLQDDAVDLQFIISQKFERELREPLG